MEEKYFIASNSSEGFCSYYDSTFETGRFSAIYIIKGGSGTGKAFFMREVAREAEKRGFSVRYIYCSSDASSLDAIIINELKIAVLDGTSPHVREPKTVGACESIVDLGAFLNTKMLRSSRKTIENLVFEKQRCFERAYRTLKAYRAISENIEETVISAVKFDKIRAYVKKFVSALESGNGREEHLLVRSIGMRGLSDFETYFENAKIYYEINDYFEIGHLFMRELHAQMREKRINIKISNNPIISTRIDAISVDEASLTFEITNEGHGSARQINMKRFVDTSEISKIRGEYRALARIRDDILERALSEFERIKKYHFILEEIYGSAMDFGAKEQFTQQFCNKIFENN